jgi:hypothetical protein
MAQLIAQVIELKWFERFTECVNRIGGKNVGQNVLKGLGVPPTGQSKRAKNNRTRWIKTAMEKLDDLCDEQSRNQIMVETCPHVYPKTRIKLMRDEFERLGNIDELITLMREDTSWGGGSFYDYPFRKGDMIHITKVPYNPKAYRHAINDEEKRLAYCHCALVKRSEDSISPTFCCCSGGWVKQLWEGIFQQPVEVEMTESLLKGNERCTHTVKIPREFL